MDETQIKKIGWFTLAVVSLVILLIEGAVQIACIIKGCPVNHRIDKVLDVLNGTLNIPHK